MSASDSITASVGVQDALRLTLVHTIVALGNIFLLICRRALWPRRPTSQPHRICVYRIGNVGDIVCALPAIRAIRRTWPQARLVLFTSPGSPTMPGATEVLAGVEWIDDLIVYNSMAISSWTGVASLLRRMRRERFDMWFELPAIGATFGTLLRNMSFARLAGARWGAGWTFQNPKLWPRLRSERRRFPNEVERLLALVRREGVASGPVEFGFPQSTEIESRAKSLLDATRLPPGAVLVGLAPGAKRSTNRWFPERFAEVGRFIIHRGYSVILVGAASDRELCDAISKEIGEGAFNLAGRTDIPLLAALLRRCHFLVAVDSGVQHIAAAVGTRCISIFSAREFHGRWHPYGDHAVIEKRVPCHTCLLEHCPHDNLCMREIVAQEVKVAVGTLLARTTCEGGAAEEMKGGG